MHQSQYSNLGLEVTYLVKFSFLATMLDSLVPGVRSQYASLA